MKEYKIITGTAKEVEDELNKLAKMGQPMDVVGMSATNETTTVLVARFNPICM